MAGPEAYALAKDLLDALYDALKRRQIIAQQARTIKEQVLSRDKGLDRLIGRK